MKFACDICPLFVWNVSEEHVFVLAEAYYVTYSMQQVITQEKRCYIVKDIFVFG